MGRSGAVFGTSLAHTLADEPDLDVVGSVTTQRAAFALLERGVDVVLSDFRLSDGDGVAFTTAVLARWPRVAVVMLTAANDEGVLAAALEAGCSGFVAKSEPLETVLAAVWAVAAGDSVITPAPLARLLPRLGTRRGNNPDLTAREQEVLVDVLDPASCERAVDHGDRRAGIPDQPDELRHIGRIADMDESRLVVDQAANRPGVGPVMGSRGDKHLQRGSSESRVGRRPAAARRSPPTGLPTTACRNHASPARSLVLLFS